MFGFLLGLVIGFVAKVAYDFAQEDRYPPNPGPSLGRMDATLDETRRIVREIRDELRARPVPDRPSGSEMDI